MKKNTITLLTALIALCLVISNAQSQPLCHIQKFSLYNGLPQRAVSTIVQDSKGFIWASTWNGLSRYDGYEFKNFKAYPGDGCSLTSNRFTNIVAGKYDDIYCQSYDGHVYLFDTRRERFVDLLEPLGESGQRATVAGLYQLEKGVVWIVDDQGGFRLDEAAYREGKPESLTRYSVAKGNLTGHHIQQVKQDTEGDEWLFTERGVTLVGKKKIDTSIAFSTGCEVGKEMYLLTRDNRLAAYSLKQQTIRMIDIDAPYSTLSMMQKLNNYTLAIGTDRSIICLDTQSGHFSPYSLQGVVQPLSTVRKIIADSQGELWIFTDEQGVTRCNRQDGRMQHYHTIDHPNALRDYQSLDFFMEDADGNVWIVPHMEMLSYYDRHTGQLRTYRTAEGDNGFTPLIRSSLVDHQGNLWYGNKFEMGKITFIPNVYTLHHTAHGEESRAFFTDSRGRLWISNKKGELSIHDSKRQSVSYLTQNGSLSSQRANFGKSIYDFMQTADGTIWMGTRWDGLMRLTPQGNGYQIEQYTYDANSAYSLSNNSIYSICQDSRGRIWVGTYGGGLNLIDESTDGEVRFIHGGNDLNGGIESKRYAKVRIVRQVGETILCGTTEGLISFSADFDKPSEIRSFHNRRQPDNAESLGSNDITYIYTDSRRHTYVLSFTGGLSQVTSDNLLTDSIRFKTYTVPDGLPSDLLLSMIEDRHGQLWVISENSLTQFDPAEGIFHDFNKHYFNNEIYYSEAEPLFIDNRLMLGTETGYAIIDTEQLKPSQYVPNIVWTGIKIQGNDNILPIEELSELTLKPDERNVTFRFAAIDYVDPQSISYAYRLKGLEEKWNEVGNNRTANYINLPPGNYELEVRSTNADGVWVDNTHRLSVKVLPAFRETPWMILVYLIVIVGAVAVAVYIFTYIYRLHHQIEMEHRLSGIKLRFFTDISHELRTPLTLISSPVSEVLEHESLSQQARKHLELVNTNTQRMLRLVNQILDFRKIENKKMKLLVEQTDISALLHQVMDSFRLMAEEKQIDFRLESLPEHIGGWIDRDKVEKVVFNLLSNAFKYTPDGGSIGVEAATDGGRLRISVRDTGIGIDSRQQQTLFQRFETLVHNNILQPSSGIGLSLVKELVELHQGTISVESRPGAGSTFSIDLPYTLHDYEGKENAELILADAEGQSTQAEVNLHTPTAEHSTTDSGENSESCSGNTPLDAQTDDRHTAHYSVLVVEDNDELRHFMADILRSSYRVLTATNGREGLQKALGTQPDFILSDVMMPEMDGLDMVRALKENPESSHIPIILLSAKSSLDDRIQGIEQGIDDYITKPFSSTYLKARIKTLLDQRSKLQQQYLKQWTERMEAQAMATANEEKPTAGEASTPGEPDRPKEEKAFYSPMPAQPQITPIDELFMQKVMEVMEQQMDNADFTIDEFARQLGMGRSVFYQKLKAIVGLSPVDFVRDIRIKRASQLIESGNYNVSTAAYMTGFNDPKYFSKCFKKYFGVSPSEYKKGE